MKCDICSSENLVQFLNLGLHPPPLNFLTNENDKEEKFPLEVYFCKSCGLVQLGNDVDPNIMFKEYLYTSGVSIAFKKHLESFAKILIERFKLTSSELVIDIAKKKPTFFDPGIAKKPELDENNFSSQDFSIEEKEERLDDLGIENIAEENSNSQDIKLDDIEVKTEDLLQNISHEISELVKIV